MKIKKFHAKSFREVLALVKREMGNDAIILSTEELAAPGEGVAVTAAVDHEQTTAGMDRNAVNASQVSVEPVQETAGRDDFSEVKKDIESIRDAIEAMKNRGFGLALPAGRQKVFRHLTKQAIREDIALSFCQKSTDLGQIAAAMAGGIRTCSDVWNRKAVMVVGPTGVGKTTTIAKLAAGAMKRRKKVAMINLDTYRIGAAEQSRIYARIMGIPLDIVSDIQELKKSVGKFSGRDLILIDTTGRNPRDDAYINELKAISELGIPVETHLLMSTNSDDGFLTEVYRRYRPVRVDCLGFTKADEAVKFGSIFNMTSLFRKPVAYITTGQQVPQDIIFPDSNRITAMVLNAGVQHA